MSSMFLWTIVVICFIYGILADTKPQEVHLALSGNLGEMVIDWVTEDDTATSTVKYGLNTNNLNMRATGSSSSYVFIVYISPSLHTATLTQLKPATRYYYQVGDDTGGWSDVFYFDTEDPSPLTPSNTLRIAIMADNGVSPNSQLVLDAIKRADDSLHFDLLLLSGDLSYANGIQPWWDYWGKMIQPLASHFPFMVAPGNHELFSLFIAYNARFHMPTNGYENLYYSFNYRGIHVIILNSESLNEYHWSAMYQWAAKDLQSVNRMKTPWVFAAFHHPWYCSNLNHNDSAWFMKQEYEDLFHKYGVDVVLQGHVHAYERTKQVYNWQVTSGATVYITNGHAGNSEGLYYGWQTPTPTWSGYRESVFGFSTMEIFNATHLHWQMIRANDSVVRDDYWLVK